MLRQRFAARPGHTLQPKFPQRDRRAEVFPSREWRTLLVCKKELGAFLS